MFDVFYWGPKPNLFEFEQPADSLEHAAELTRTGFYWYIYGGGDFTNFDFDYHPVPWQKQFVHVWPTQWNQFGGAYLAHKNTAKNLEYHFHNDYVPARSIPANFETLHRLESFDYSWVPHPMDPPYIYVFGNQWHSAERMPTVEYHVPGATERKYMSEPVAKLAECHDNRWHTLEDCEWDYSWVPDPHDPPYIYVFGNEHWSGERSATVEYHVPGATERKYVGDLKAKLSTLDIFYIDHNNDTATTRYELLKNKYPHIQKVRYANSIMDTISRCVKRTGSARFWVISSEYDYTDFDFDWHPEPWQYSMTHVFPSQHQKWSNTFLINRYDFERHSAWAKSLEEFPNLNFVTNQTVTKTENRYNIYYVDHGNTVSQHQYEYLRADRVKGVDIIKTRFVDNYLDTFKRIMSTAQTEYVWIINSICDYSNFDFTWEPEPWQQEMIHVFPSGMQERGNTFYIHVESFKQQMIELELLDWFNVINYCDEQNAPYFDMPVHVYNTDDLVTEIKNYDFKEPYAMFTNQPNLQFVASPCLWSEKDRVVERCSVSGATCIVPRDIKRYLKTQIYDYPHLEASVYQVNEYDKQQDIIFISYDEAEADVNWAKLKAQYPRAKRLHGVKGMEKALQAAAELSSTPWYYAVFAKTEIVDTFDFSFSPDYYQQPKHYIFYAHNETNGLEYGYAGVILYNVNLVNTVTEFGIDYTMSAPHAVIPKVSAKAKIGATPYQAWRSAFRECAKLAQIYDDTGCLETEHRLHVWRTKANGPNAEWVLNGARDGVEFYKANKGNNVALKQAFYWEWLTNKFTELYPGVAQ